MKRHFLRISEACNSVVRESVCGIHTTFSDQTSLQSRPEESVRSIKAQYMLKIYYIKKTVMDRWQRQWGYSNVQERAGKRRKTNLHV